MARRTNQLGFRSRVLLDKHFSKYGDVVQVMVAHSKVRSIGDVLLPRTRPGNLGLVVMRSEAAVQQILADGPVHIIQGVLVNVHRFDQKNMDREEGCAYKDSPESASSAHSGSTSSAHSGSSGDPMGVPALDHLSPEGMWPPGLMPYVRGQEDFQQQLHGGHHDPGVACAGSQPWMTAAAPARRIPSMVLSPPAAAPVTPPMAPPVSHSETPPAVSHVAGLSEQATAWCHPKSNLDQSRQKAALRQLAKQAQQAQQSLKIIEEMCTQNLREIPYADVPPLPVSTVAPAVFDAASRPPALLDSLMHQYRTALRHCDSAAAVYAAATSFGSTASSVLPEDQMIRRSMAALAAASASAASNEVVTTCQNPGSPGARAPDCTDKAVETPMQNSDVKPQEEPEQGPPATDVCGTTAQYSKSKAFSRRESKDTLVSHLARLQNEDPACVFVARGIAKLGFRSKEFLHSHYSRFGKVSSIFTAHSKTKLARDSPGAFRTRPGSLGLVTMATAEAVQQILALGERQEVAGHGIQIQPFRRPKPKPFDSDLVCEGNKQEDKAPPSSHGGASTATTDDQSSGQNDNNSSNGSSNCSGKGLRGLEGHSNGSNGTRSEGSSGDADIGSSDGSEEGNGSSPSR